MLNPELEAWAKSAANYFQEAFGLSGPFSLQAARLYVALWWNGLEPRISRGFSDPAHQREDRAGLRVRPADVSKHSSTGFYGQPAATAIDMPSSNEQKAASIAQSIGLGAGLAFTKSDPGHYYLLGAGK
jgi:hypothetical protein